MKPSYFMLLFAVPFCLGNSCDPALNQNPDFEFWCDDSPCGWDVTDGRIERAPTWRAGDDGVRLIGPEVVMEQSIDETTKCMAISVLTDVPTGASMVMEFDFQDDGNVEHTHPLDGQNWKNVDFKLTTPVDYTALRVRIRKLGDADATLARLRIGRGENCFEAPLELRPLADGIACAKDAQCESGVCVADGICNLIEDDQFATCAADADCAALGSDQGCFKTDGICGRL